MMNTVALPPLAKGIRRAAITLAVFVAAIACGAGVVAPSPSPTTSETPTGSPLSSASTSATPSALFGQGILGAVSAIAAPCILDRALVRADILLWTSCDRSTPALTSRIMGYSLPSGPTRVLYQPKLAATGISLQQISADWIAWAEYLNKTTASDTKLFALARSGGSPILIDDMTTHGTLVSLSDIALDGSDIYWSLPLIDNGVWHGRLMRKHLPDGAPTIAVQAPLGSIVSWPSVSGGMIAYELRSQTAHPQDRVIVQFADGRTQQIGTAAASEPSLGDGFVAYKSAERFDSGDLAAYRFADGVTVPLGPGEGPSVSGRFVTWRPSAPLDNVVRLARPLSGCVDKMSPQTIREIFNPAVGSDSLSWVVRVTPEQMDTEQIFFAAITATAGAPCRP